MRAWGSSPHVRGAHDDVREEICFDGIIPACAESTESVNERRGEWRDHPRMCGEHLRDSKLRRAFQGIIPACAGSTDWYRIISAWIGDHPRMCGEHSAAYSSTDLPMGSSPHVRGAPAHDHRQGQGSGIIPACAGSTYQRTCCKNRVRDHPRMCGEHPKVNRIWSYFSGSSPHVRGAPSTPAPRRTTSRDHPRMCGEHRSQRRGSLSEAGIIPACAGSTIRALTGRRSRGDHPRMCGEHKEPLS